MSSCGGSNFIVDTFCVLHRIGNTNRAGAEFPSISQVHVRHNLEQYARRLDQALHVHRCAAVQTCLPVARHFSEGDALAEQLHVDLRDYAEAGRVKFEPAQALHRVNGGSADVLDVQVENRGVDQHENVGHEKAHSSAAFVVEEVTHDDVRQVRVPEEELDRGKRQIVVSGDEQELLATRLSDGPAQAGAKAEVCGILQETDVSMTARQRTADFRG